MNAISNEYKIKVVEALLAARHNFDGTDKQFAVSKGIKGSSVFSRLKRGEIDGLLKIGDWINIGRGLGVSLYERKWNSAKTDVFLTIEQDVLFCKEHSKAKIFVDACEIGKTHTAKYLSKTIRNCFYIDASQCKYKQHFVRELAKVLGLNCLGNYVTVKENIKYYLKMIEKPIIIIDEAGDLEYHAFLELKEFWNATENCCGWYMMGADGLKHKIEQGIAYRKVGYLEIFSRFSNRYTSVVPTAYNEKVLFMRKLITDVVAINVDDKSIINQVVNKCITKDDRDNIGGLRRAESILILNR